MFAALLLALQLTTPAEASLVGQRAPELHFAYALQGDDVEFDLRERKVRVIGLFQLGCTPSVEHLLPALKALRDKHPKEPHLDLFGVATALPGGAGAADGGNDAAVREMLSSRRAYFQVMRDLDGAIARHFSINGVPGSSRAMVIDATGQVRWHGTVDSAVTEALHRFFVEPIAGLAPELAAFAKGDFAAAVSAARRIAGDAKATPELKAQAEQAIQAMEGAARKLLDSARALRSEGYPGYAKAALEDASKVFTLVPASAEAGKLLAEWTADRTFRKELTGEQRLKQSMKLLERPKDSVESLRKRFADFMVTYGDTAIAPRIRAALARLD
jgi:hypothetical protein